MITALALMALGQAASAPQQAPPRARILAFARIVSAAEIRGGRTAEPHKRREVTRDGQTVRLIEFE